MEDEIDRTGKKSMQEVSAKSKKLKERIAFYHAIKFQSTEGKRDENEHYSPT